MGGEQYLVHFARHLRLQIHILVGVHPDRLQRRFDVPLVEQPIDVVEDLYKNVFEDNKKKQRKSPRTYSPYECSPPP